MDLRSCLIIRISAIGDVVLSSAMYRCIKAVYPDIRLSVVCGTQVAPLLENHPLIDELLVYDKRKGIITGELQTSYDHICDLQHNRHSARILSKVRGPLASLDKQNLRKWLMVNGKWKVANCRHRLSAYFSCAPPGVQYDGKGLDLIPPPEDWVVPVRIENEYSVLIPGAAHGTKAIPYEVAVDLLRKIKGRVVVLGGPAETDIGEKLEAAFPGQCISLCGKLNVRDSAWMIARAEKVIGGDTGLSHIAAAYDRNLDLIWGSTVPGFGMGPVFSDTSKAVFREFQVPDLGCRPCSKLGYSACPNGHFRCMLENPARFV
jgi:ADP-heptose:LPS heptosyltransferase